MKKIAKKITVSLVAIFAIITNISQINAVETNPTVKIGLLYGSNAVPTTNLDNYDGSGHQFGYFDSNENFVSVFSTDFEKITIMKDKTIYLGSDGLYYDTALSNSSGLVGAYHIELSFSYNNANDAKYTAMTIHEDAFVAYVNGVYRIRVDSFSSSANATSALSKIKEETGDLNAYVVSPSTEMFTVTSTKTTDILFEFSNNTNFVVKPNGEQTWTKGYRYNGVFEYSRQSDNDITVVNVVDMQDYVKGVVPYEMSASWELEALKAQALCARSYGYNFIGKHSRYEFDLCNGIDCQVYNGTSGASENSNKAVDDTIGEYIDYNGKIATGFFYSSNGGASENSENVWTEKIDYLVGKIDPYERTEEINNGIWTITITDDQIEWILEEKGYDLNGVSKMYISEYTDMGNVLTLVIEDKSGVKHEFSKERARTILNSTTQGIDVKSTRYRINENFDTSQADKNVYINDKAFDANGDFSIIGQSGTIQTSGIGSMNVLTASGLSQIGETVIEKYSSNGTYTINGRGWGHSVGMSQYGARHMAQAGYTYKEIIEFYFTGAKVK